MEAIQNQVTMTHVIVKEMKETVDKVCNNLNFRLGTFHNMDFAGKEAPQIPFKGGGN